jgi:exopolyphosphatase / guanosine-5'-triphosphate,3'-diphosphate pyrophosphatase
MAATRAGPSARRAAGQPRTGAAIDIGSTSVHLSVAEIHDHLTRSVADASELLRLGDTVDAAGILDPPARIRLIASLLRFAEVAQQAGAVQLTIVATEPFRRAANAADAAAEIERAGGHRVQVLDHDEEGLLTLIGVTGGRPVERELLVVDVGGGSSEFVDVRPGARPTAAGVRLGAARLTAGIVRHDPPSPDELHTLLEEARRLVGDAPDAAPARIVVVGGTASNVLRVVPGASADRQLSRRRIAAALVLLAQQPAAAVAEAYGVNATRARILPAGAAILGAILERYAVPRLGVSESGIREGAILAADRAGADWRSQLPDLAGGWA